MIVTKSMVNSKPCQSKDKWETPDALFSELNDKHHFTLDPCCEPETAKCKTFYTESINGLNKSWHGHRVFVNPPYSRGRIEVWVKKCFDESQNGVYVVALLPVSTSSKWFHDYVLKAESVTFLKGRVKFKGAKSFAPFSSMIVKF